MKKRTVAALLWLAGISAIPGPGDAPFRLGAWQAQAENYPYRSDMLWVTLPDHPDWLYRIGEKAEVAIQLLRYGIPAGNTVVKYSLATDMLPADTEGEVTLDAAGRAVIPLGTMTEPGFRNCVLTAEIDGTRHTHHVKVGFSPERLAPFTEMPADFDTFWDNALQELARVPLDYTIEDVPELSTDKFTCRLVNLKISRQGQSIYGYLFVPRGATPGSCPIVLSPPGAGIKTIREPLRHRYYPENGIIRFEMEIHGLDPRMSDAWFAEISRAFGGKENGYLLNGLDNRDNYYMKRVYTGLVRAIDFLTTLPEWDGRNLATQGGSQGGALAIVAAALDNRVTACAANHPALSDMARYTSGKTGGYPHLYRIPGMDTPDKTRTLQYYDVVNFARRLKVPVFMTWGYNDDTCPPTTSYIVYNAITSPKEALITPVNEHWTSEATERHIMDWLLSHTR